MRSAVRLLVVLVVCAAVLQAQAPPGNTADTFILQYRASRASAIAAFTMYAQGLFRALALCEMAWVGVLLVLERTDLQGFTATLLRKLLVLFFFFWLLLNGANFSDLIMRSFTIYGQAAAGGPGGFGAGDIVWRGILAAENLLSGASLSAFLAGPAGAGAIVLCAVIVVVSFGVVALQYIMAMVESIICVSAGLLFLGFGGNSVTRPYVERFFALAVATGVKLMVLYIIIGIGETLTSGWAATAATISGLANPIRLIFDMMVGSLIYAVLAWGVPRFAASLLTGSSAFSGSDVLQMGFSVAQAGIMVAGAAALAASGGAALVGGGAARLAAASQAGASGSAGAAGSTGPVGPAGGPGGMGSGGGSREGSGSSGRGANPRPPGANTNEGTSNASSAASSTGSNEGVPAAPGTVRSETSNSTAPPTAGVPSQVQPPGSKWAAVAGGAKAVQGAANVAYRGAYTAAQMSFFLQRIIPHDGGGHGSPPSANMHGE